MTDRCLLGQHSFIPDWITATASCLYSLHSVSPICSERCGSANFQNSTIKTHYSCAHQPLLAARPRTYLVQTGSHDVSIHPAFRPTYSHVSPVLPTWHPDDGCGPSILHIVWTFRPFVSLQSASGRFQFLVPPSGTTCLFTSHLRRHSRFSNNDSRPFCFPVFTKTLSYDSCVTITIHHYLSGHLWSLQ